MSATNNTIRYKSLEEKMNDLDANFREQLFHSRHVPDLLFQYTDVHGLKGILESNNWRATHYQYLNDGKEIIYGDEMIGNFLEERLKAESDAILKCIYTDVLGFAYGKPSIFRAFNYDIYLTSFSGNGDLLDQWRAYGADGLGYSIGINPWELKYKIHGPVILSAREGELPFIKVIYDEKEQSKLIMDIVHKATEIIKTESASIQETEYDQFCREATLYLSRILVQLTLLFKDSAFKNEEEWRVVKTRGSQEAVGKKAVENVSFRTSSSKLIPYLELDFSSREHPEVIPLKELILGPKHRNTNALSSLKMFLLRLGYNQYGSIECEPKVSRIFYR